MDTPLDRNLHGRPLLLWKHAGLFPRLVIALCLLLTVYAYLPTLQADFAAQDQWRAFRYSPLPGSGPERAAQCMDSVAGFYLFTGRPLVWLGECAEHAAVARIADFAPLRPLALALVLVSVLVVGAALSMLPGGFPTGVAAAAALATAPGYSFMYMQSLTAAMVLVSLALAAASQACLGRALPEADAPGQLRQVRVGKALALFLASCLMYPAWAFCVLPLCFAEFCLAPARPLRRRLLRLAFQLAFFFIAAMLYYVLGTLAAWATTAVAGSMPAGEAYQLSMRLDAATLAQRVADAARQLVTNPPLSFDLPAGALPASLIPPALILARTMRRQTGLGAPRAAALGAGAWLLGCLLLLGSLSPWLFSRMEPLFTRHTLAASLFFCLGAASLPGLLLPPRLAHADRLSPLLALLVLTLPAALWQHSLSRLETQVSGAEIAFLRKELGQWLDARGWETTRRVLVVPPSAQRTREAEAWLDGSPRAGENAVLASSQNPVSIPWMLNAVLRERRDHPLGTEVLLIPCGDSALCADMVAARTRHVALQVAAPGPAPAPGPGVLVIDLNRLTSCSGPGTGQGQALEDKPK